MKKLYRSIFVIMAISHFQYAYSQGCVAIRGNSSCGGIFGNTLNLTKGEFNLLPSYRYFKSYKHFRGDHQEAERVEQGTEVINHSNFLDITLSYGISDRLFANLTLPFVFHTRSSMYEHGGNPPNGLGERHETSSHGLADMRIGVGYWLFDPSNHDFNYSIGLGVKLPTGKYDYTDMFYNQGVNRDQDIEAVVDQSIQPGDGGTGFSIEMQGYQPLSHSFGLSANLFYLFNPKETNGVPTRSGMSEYSCPDQFGLRLGGYYNSMGGFNAYFGGRVEGVPAQDAFGGSAGFRRPGYAVSIEPGVGYFKNSYSVFMSVPIAVYRNRTQSYEDKKRTEETGVDVHGDAAFADYLINLGFSYRFGGRKNKEAKTLPSIIDLPSEVNN